MLQQQNSAFCVPELIFQTSDETEHSMEYTRRRWLRLCSNIGFKGTCIQSTEISFDLSELHVRQTEKRFKMYTKIKYSRTLWPERVDGSNLAAKLNLTGHASSFVYPNDGRSHSAASRSCCSSKIPQHVYRHAFLLK